MRKTGEREENKKGNGAKEKEKWHMPQRIKTPILSFLELTVALVKLLQFFSKIIHVILTCGSKLLCVLPINTKRKQNIFILFEEYLEHIL